MRELKEVCRYMFLTYVLHLIRIGRVLWQIPKQYFNFIIQNAASLRSPVKVTASLNKPVYTSEEMIDLCN